MNYTFKALSGILSMLILVSCQSYKPLPLESKKILEEVNNSRQYDVNENFDFEQAATLMSQRNHRLKVLQQKYEKFQKIAAIKTPLANPELEVGPAFGSNLEDTTASSTQPFIGIGFSIPLGPRLARNDDLNKAKELQAYNALVIEHRKLYFELRAAYIDYMLSQQKLKALEKVELTMQLTRKVTQKLIEIGTSTKLGFSQVNLQLAEVKMTKLAIETEMKTALGKLSRLISVEMGSLEKIILKQIKLPMTHFNLQNLQKNLLNNNTSLAAIEMEFHIADQELKLELAKQYPDLKFGLTSEDDVGEDQRTISVPFSIELPLFDQNRQGISAAFSERKLKLIEYKNELSNQLSFLEEEVAKYSYSRQKTTMIKNDILPLSQENINDAEQALKLGSIGTLRYLDLLIQHQRYQLATIDSQKQQWEKILNLEKISGRPIIPLSKKDSTQLKDLLKPLKVNK
jgi:outer membrane protein, heavy metal efflux system